MPTETDTRIHDIEAAHEAAQLENEIIDAHTAALQENEIFDAYEAALKEDQERTETMIHIQQPEQQEEKATAPEAPKEPQSEQASNPLAAVSQEELRVEAATALKEAGFPDAQIYLNGEIHKDLDGKITILHDNSAKVITHMPGGKPQVTEYTYDKDSNTITVATGTNIITGRAIEYEPTQDKQWQTRQDIITLPAALAKRFGMERAIVTGQ